MSENRPPSSSHDCRVWEKDGKEMVRVPAGEFFYGDDKQKVSLPEFWIDKTPVTNAEFARFVQATNHEPPSHWQGKTPPQNLVDHPVVKVSRQDAAAYAAWAGKRLPTEQEWEKAARGTDGRTWPWGNRWVDGQCNTSEAGVGDTTAVGRYSLAGDSPYGVADMAGNVFEWTADWYEAYPGSTYTSGDFGKKFRALRGGSWIYPRVIARCASRSRFVPDRWYYLVGFRVVVSPADADF